VKSTTMRWPWRSAQRSLGGCGRSSKKRPVLLEQVEDRIALSGGAISNPAAISLAVTRTAGGLVASNLYYTAQVNVTLSPRPGVLAYVKPQVSGLSATFGFPSRGALQSSSNGLWSYTSGQTGRDSFTYYATAGSLRSNVATVSITIISQAGLIPNTPYYHSLVTRWSIDPARFEFYHPRIGALIGMEVGGMPAFPTKIVPVNKHFNVTAARSLHAKNPLEYDQRQPVLGALFQLEKPASADVSLLPKTAYYNAQRRLYDSHPAEYQVKHVYLGALFAIENFEQTGGTVVAAT
jgi:hypothetical protein